MRFSDVSMAASLLFRDGTSGKWELEGANADDLANPVIARGPVSARRLA